MSSTARLDAAIDELLARDLDALTDSEREALAVDITRQVPRLQAAQARAVNAVRKSRSFAADGSEVVRGVVGSSDQRLSSERIGRPGVG